MSLFEPNWVNFVVGLSAVFAVIGALYRYVVRPAFRAASTLDRATPVLLDIAGDFRQNGGSNLKEIIEDRTQRLNELRDKVEINTAKLQNLSDKIEEIRDEIRELNSLLQVRQTPRRTKPSARKDT